MHTQEYICFGNVISKVEMPFEMLSASEFIIKKDDCFWTQSMILSLGKEVSVKFSKQDLATN